MADRALSHAPGPPPARVRPRLDGDLPGCVTALASVQSAYPHPYPLVWPDDPHAWLHPAGLLAAWVGVPGSSNGMVSGHVAVCTGGVVSRLFVVPSSRGQGLGAALLAAAVTRIHADGLRATLDVVGDDGPAIALYERLGWQLTTREPAAWTTPAGLRPFLRTYVEPAGSGPVRTRAGAPADSAPSPPPRS